MPRKRKRTSKQNQQSSPPSRLKPAPQPPKEVPIPPLGWRAALPILVAVAGLVAYANSLDNEFVLEDHSLIVNNERIHALSSVADLLSTPRPVTNLTLAINYAVGALNPWGYRLVNVAIHILAALTLYGIVRRTLILPKLRADLALAAPWLALAVALIWAVHPLQTESVTYLAQRSELLVGLFYLLTVYCVLRGAGAARGGWWYAAAVLCCALGMGSEYVMVAAPLVVLLYDRVFLSGTGSRIFTRRPWLYVGLAATWIIAILLPLTATHDAGPTDGLAAERASPAVYAMTQPGVVLQYIKLAFWPSSLCVDYDWNLVRNAERAAAPTVVITILVLWTVWAVVRRQPLGFASAFFFLVLAPTSSFLPWSAPMAEHRMYLPLASVVVFTVFAAYGLMHDFAGRTGRPIALATLLIIAVGVLAWHTIDRNRDYRDTLTVWRDVLTKRPDNVRAHAGLGKELFTLGEYESAAEHFRAVIEQRPDYANAYRDLGTALLRTGQHDLAAGELQNAIDHGVAEATVYLDLGEALERGGRLDEAVDAYERAAWLQPDDPRAVLGLGDVQSRRGDSDRALWYYDYALRLDPEFIPALMNKAAVYMGLDWYDDAWLVYDRVLELDPDHEDACERRGTAAQLIDGGALPSPTPTP